MTTRHGHLHPPPTAASPAIKKKKDSVAGDDRSTMMGMGYFRSTTKGAAATSPTAGKKKAKKLAQEDAGLRESLLEPSPAAAAEGGGGGVPKGYFAVYAGEESRRFVVPTGYLREPAFRDLMERAADEFGFAQAGGLRVPCAEEDFEDLLRRLHRKNAAGGGKGKKAVR